MGSFAVRFLICNLYISVLTGILLAAKCLLRKRLTSRMQYHLWFLLLGLLAAPFLPLRSLSLSWPGYFRHAAGAFGGAAIGGGAPAPAAALSWMNDFGVAISRKAPSGIGLLLFVLWAAGMAGMAAWTLRSAFLLRALKKSSLPLKNPGLAKLYRSCLSELHITRGIPIYGTAGLKSPAIAGLFRPCIYMPIHLIQDSGPKELRYMLLHELSHYRHKDFAVNYLMHLARILYWFNPAVWYALHEMKTDREIACDTSVLKLLEADAYQDYGNTLINLAEKISRSPFPFATGINGGMAQMKKRVLNIATYEKTSLPKIILGASAFVCIAVFMLSFLPGLSLQASGHSRYSFREGDKNIIPLDLKEPFGSSEGSFVLYDAQNDTWQIYNQELARTRVAPVSTYKIYSALLGLEMGIISPDHSLLPWDGRQYGFGLWNCDQTLPSAMANSVNWYFQEIDRQAGPAAVRDYIQEIGYGSRTASGDTASYWSDSSLCISPLEQVEMLQKLYYNQFGFSPENIKAVKDSIYLYTEGGSAVYGKTGTGNIDGKNALGWFIGYIEQNGRIYFFATNIRSGELASGSAAAELTISILSGLGILV